MREKFPVVTKRGPYPTTTLHKILKKLILYHYHYAYYMPKCNFVQLFLGASDRHVTFTTSFRLDASFAMALRALRPDLDRAKSAPDFEAKTGQTCLPRF